jgi:hypothetical protein
MITNGKIISCGGLCHKVKLNMFYYQLSTPMYDIGLDNIDGVLNVQWLHTIGTISINFDALIL